MTGLRPSRRLKRERWDGTAFNVKSETHPGLGTVTVLELMFIGADGVPEHVLEVTLDDGSRRNLAQALSGGVVLAPANGLGAHPQI